MLTVKTHNFPPTSLADILEDYAKKIRAGGLSHFDVKIDSDIINKEGTKTETAVIALEFKPRV